MQGGDSKHNLREEGRVFQENNAYIFKDLRGFVEAVLKQNILNSDPEQKNKARESYKRRLYSLRLCSS